MTGSGRPLDHATWKCNHNGVSTVTLSEARKDLSAAIRKSRRGPVFVQSRGRCVAAIVSAGDLEDLEDIRAADAALAEHAKDPSGAVTLEDYLRRRGGRPCGTR